MEGTIKRIYLKNFASYNEVSVTPCDNLNIIIGPNGTGKSTIVSAIMLGLGERPNSIGLDKKVEEFIKLGCQEATITLELIPDYKVDRKIAADGRSIFKLNEQVVPEKEIKAFTKRLNIQVGNLCQFLPQDRVSDFARMNQKQLLINTEKAVGGDELVSLHEELIEMQNSNQNAGGDLIEKEKSLAAKREQNARLDVDVTTLTEKNNLELEIGNCKKKLLWMRYVEAKAKHDHAKRECVSEENALKEVEAASEPLRRQKSELERKCMDIKNKRKTSATSYDSLEMRLKSELDEVQEAFSKVKSLENNDKRNATREQARVEKIQSIKRDIEERDSVIAEIKASLTEKKRKLPAITAELDKYGSKISVLDEQIRQIKGEASQFRYECQVLENQISAAENVFSQKLELLRRVNNDAHKGVLWLQRNRHLFSGNVYMPLMIELNVSNPIYAKYVENAIGYRDLVAFSCDSAEDFNLLTNELRGKQRLRISVLSTDIRRPIPEQPVPTDVIKRLGFEGFLINYVDGPEPLLKYLKASCNLQQIPVADKEVPIDVNLPSGIKKYYAGGECVTISGSRYSPDPIKMSFRVRDGNCLAISQNVSKLDDKKHRLHIAQEMFNDCKAKMSNLSEEKDRLNEFCAQKREERNAILSTEADLNTTQLTRNRYQEQLDDLQREQQIFLTERNHLQRKIHDLVIKAVKKQIAAATVFENVREVIHKVKMAKIEESIEKRKLVNIDKTCKIHQTKINDAKEKLELAKNHYKTLAAEAKELYNDAKKETEGFDTNDEGFKKFATIFQTFPQDIEELEEFIDQKNALVACKRNVDTSVLTEYQARAREIKELEKEILETKEAIVKHKTKMASMQALWLEKVQLLVNKISRNFSKYFKEINCVGDVVLERGNDEHDYKNYGLSIKVSYRASEPMKELDSFFQSGGERSVATALYMLSLQELTKVPFRCVDEINQGMDENNERLVYKILMSITSRENTSQYFLLTPKLLKGMDYSDNCMVHCVFNGPQVPRHTDWKMDAFLSRKSGLKASHDR